MTSPTLPLSLGAAYLRLLDAKDETAIHNLLADDAQMVDDDTRRWVRGRDAIGGVLRATLSRMADLHSTAEDVRIERWGDVEVETFTLRQVYDLDDSPCWAVSPTMLVWRRTGDGWRLAVIDSVPTCG